MLSGGQAREDSGGAAGLGRDRGTLLIGGLLFAVAALAWTAVVRQAGGVSPEMDAGMAMSAGPDLVSLAGAAAFLAAWGIMMVAMMLPSATPMIALYGAMHRHQGGRRDVPTALFALVYLALWLAFGVPVYAATIAVDFAAANPAIAGRLPYALALLLLAAGAYQLSPLKRVCLRACQSPLSFLMGHWRSGRLGALRLGLAHAAYCVGCCWALMAVLVAAGAMALHWVLLIAAVVFAEKLLPRGEWTARLGGVALLALGLLVAAQPDWAALLRGPAM